MSLNCNKTITNGFDITLSDGNSYHFSLTTQDQLNLITLATMVESGETQIPYHADGEPCKFYSATDISAIIAKATEFKTYHISYYNSLKTYINSMETIDEIGRYRRNQLQKTHNLKDVFIETRGYLVGNATGTTRDEFIAKQMINLILCKIYDERFTAPDALLTFRTTIDDTDEEVSERINDLFEAVKAK